MVQRVTSASVDVDGRTVGQIGTGLLVLVGITHDDGPAEVAAMASKLAGLRVLHGDRSCLDGAGAILLVSQFTLYGDTRRGRRPTWAAAAPGPVAEPLYESLAQALRDAGVTVETGEFGADMGVSMEGDGPVTLIVDV